MTESLHDPNRARQEAAVPWWRVLLAPALDVFRPRAAAHCLLGAPRAAFIAVLVLSLLVITAILVALMLWEGTVTEVLLAPTGIVIYAGSQPPLPSQTFDVHRHTLAEVWTDWHEHAIEGWLGPPLITLFFVAGLGLPLLALGAWLVLPFVHRHGPAWRSYWCSFRVASGLLWPLSAALLLCGTAVVVREHSYWSGQSWAIAAQPGFALLVTSSVAIWALAFWLERAVDAIPASEPEITPPPRCERCGYDLTHQPDERRCPECGLDVDASLVMERSRPGCLWATRRTLFGWLQTARGVLFRPHSFYRRLQLRAPRSVEAGFVFRNMLLLGVAALTWAGVMLIEICRSGRPPPREDWPMLPVLAVALVLWGLFACSFGHRVGAALVATIWLVRRELPDFRWAVKVIVYESVFLCVFCFFWGTLLVSFVLFGPWLSGLVRGTPGLVFVRALPLEALALPFGAVALSVVWLWRYEIAYRAIRWSNF